MAGVDSNAAGRTPKSKFWLSLRPSKAPSRSEFFLALDTFALETLRQFPAGRIARPDSSAGSRDAIGAGRARFLDHSAIYANRHMERPFLAFLLRGKV